MGLNIQALKILFEENSHREISGDVLLIGKSTVAISRKNLDKFFRINGLNLSTDQFLHKDLSTKRSSNVFDVDDVELLQKMFPKINKIDILDISPIEGANIVADLNKPIDEKLKFKYDFIYDSSVLDNVFNPAQMIENVAQLLNASGRVLMVNVASFFPGAMVSCHPEWFYSFFAINDFSDAKIYLAIQEKYSLDQFQYSTTLWLYKPTFSKQENYNYFEAVTSTKGVGYVYALAELGTKVCEKILQPVNLQYIDSSNNFDWSKKQDQYDASTRGVVKSNIVFDHQAKKLLPHNTDHYIYIGQDF
jgi:hypothetical protein